MSPAKRCVTALDAACADAPNRCIYCCYLFKETLKKVTHFMSRFAVLKCRVCLCVWLVGPADSNGAGNAHDVQPARVQGIH